MGNRKSAVTPEQRKAFGKWMTQQHINLMQRLQRYIQISDLANLLGMERATVSKYLDGIIVPSGDTLIKIANFFENDEVYDIVGYDRPTLSKQDLKQQILNFLREDNKDDDFLDELEREIQNARSRPEAKAIQPQGTSD